MSKDVAATPDVSDSRAGSTEQSHTATDLARALTANTADLLEYKREIEQINGWFEIALNNMARGLSMFDAEARLIVCNDVYRQIYELPEELTRRGTPLLDIISYHVKKETGRNGEKDRESQRQWIETHVAELARGKSFSHTQRLRNGRIVVVSNQPLPGGGWVDLQEDVTEKRRAERKISWLARNDTLTAISNRFSFREELKTAFDKLEAGAGFAVHWIDLDRFKEVNDTLGHPVGDALLKSVASRLRKVLRKRDVVARLGGDEFAILQVGTAKAEATSRLATRVLNAVREPHNVLGHKVTIGASIGIALAPTHGGNADEILRNADLALYVAKTTDNGGYAFFQPGGDYSNNECHQLERDLSVAVQKGQLELHYQPIVDLVKRDVVGFEALMRWRHPRRGLIQPADFIPLAEVTGHIVELGRWALQEACKEAMGWPEHVKVMVNLSPAQFECGDLYQTTIDALNSSGLPGNRLELEITETLLLRDDLTTYDVLHKLRGLGIGISLDDFGTAYASLSYLRSFPFDKIKIDRSFILHLGRPRGKACVAIIQAIVVLAKEMQIRTVAEGVETLEHVKAISTAGCEEIQGFYFSRPVPAADVGEVLSQCRSKLNAIPPPKGEGG